MLEVGLKVGARASPLSRAQVAEVAAALKVLSPEVQLFPIYIDSMGDKDRHTSLRTLEKTDFFTREIDALLLNGECRIAVHSAKDLPESIPKGLMIVALTKGLDPTDALVFRPGENLETLSPGAWIATSSDRRETAVKALRDDLQFIDLRGTIGERLKKLETREADGVVVAEAALLRLGFHSLNRIKIPGSTTPYQGQLAILARQGDLEMAALFEPFDIRKKILHTGLEPLMETLEWRAFHLPLIKIVPRPPPKIFVETCTHVIFGSKNAVRIALQHDPSINKLVGIAVGKGTTEVMVQNGFTEVHTAEIAQTEGIVALLDTLDLQGTRILWPHAARSRPVLRDELLKRGIPFEEWIAYDTYPISYTPIDLSVFEEVFFSSPSTVEAFAALYPKYPTHLKLRGIGAITELSIAKYISSRAE